ncbi:hypothetical protein [Winogradskyella thalassocola]|nr:hypothetical protein [Winogradskyella thalassocola]
MLLLLFPLVEGLLFGSRKPFFEVFLILIISIFYYKKPNINLKSISVVLISAIGLLVISASILFSREESKEGSVDVRNEIINGKYNDLLKPNDQVLNYFEDESISSAQKDYALIILQSSQYITHGVFEYNHIIDMPDLAVTKGMYTFYPFRKFFNKLGFITEFDNVNPSPRKFVYLTAFGSLYIDFRWFTLLFFFLFGMFQRYVYDKSFSSSIHSPILIYLTIINVFLPILNYMRGAGIYPIVGFLFVLITHYYFLKISNEKSTNT